MFHQSSKQISLVIFIVLFLITMPVYAVNNFKISNYAGGHQIWFEAEDFDERDPADFCRIVDKAGAFGQAVTRGGGRGRVHWTFDISATGGKGGVWHFWGRILNPENRSDFMLVEGHPGDPEIPGPPYPGGGSAPEFDRDDDRIFEQTAIDWDWWGQQEGSDKVLQGSQNKMYIYHRQGNGTVFWDVFMWTDNPDYVPTDEDYQNALRYVPGPASNPSPANGVIIQDTRVNLIWTPGPLAASHDVYFGENFDEVATDTGGTFQGRQTETVFIVGSPGYLYPDGLVPGTTYYWRIDEVEFDGVTKHRGTVWSFFIPPSKAYNPVPPDGAKFVATSVTLTWAAGLGAELYTVYFGDDPDTVANAVGGIPQMHTQYYPGVLEFDRTYYWRVDEFDGAATHKGNIWSFTTEPAAEPSVVSTFHCIGVYWSPQGGSADKDVLVDYRPYGTSEWSQALPMRYNPIGTTREDKAYYRGSIVNLTPDTEYEIHLTLEGTAVTRTLEARTWSEDFPIGATVKVDNHSGRYDITASGTADAYILYDGTGSTINVNNNSDYCIFINASYVVVRGFNLTGARQHGIYIEGGHDIIIEDCDISNWGDSDNGGIFGTNIRAGIFSRYSELKRVIIQRCKIHHPRYDSNSWAEIHNNSYHPNGPQCIAFRDSAGNNVIRYNECWSDAEHYFNDTIGFGSNASYRGFPGADSDIYCNYVADCWDDGIEAEGGGQNVRIWNNYIERCLMAIGNAPISIGPTYIWRNVSGESYCLRNEYGNLLKMGFAEGLEWMTGHMYVFHNTIFQPDGRGFGGLGCARNQSGMARYIYHCTTRNNILHVRETDAVSISYRGGDNDFDYDLHSKNVPQGHESNGINGIPTYVSGAGFDFATMTGDFQLDELSVGYDAGELIPNFSDGYAGLAPDMGAHEAGSPPMEFGVDAYQ